MSESSTNTPEDALNSSDTPTGSTPDEPERRTLGIAADTPPSPEISASDGDDSGDEPAEDSRASREAARYRRQLRDVEGERDALRAQLDAIRRVEVDAQVARLGVKPAAVWASGVTLADVVAEDGTVDADRVAAAVAAARERFGLKTQRRIRGFKSGLGAAGAGVSNSWQSAFAPRTGE